jgi:tetratricopeptide (TPR) repeat protein
MPTASPTELLRNELEQRFDLDVLHRIARDLLALAPDDIAPDASRAAFARALVDRCVRDDMQEALADAITLTDRSAEAGLRPVYEGRYAEDFHPGAVVEGLKITKRTHDEGISTVYLATGPEGRLVTLKVLREGRVRDRRGLQRFLVAQRALRAIEHPAVQRVVTAAVLPDGRPYLAYEHIDGQLLSARLSRAGAMHINEAKGVLQAICEGLDKVHAVGLAHADIRADHVVLVRRDGALSGVLVDFGIDRLLGVRPGVDPSNLVVLVATARGLAPERIRQGSPADARSDVYALGALTWEILTARPLFGTASGIDLVLAHLTQEPEAPSKVAPRGWVSKEIDAVVLKALAKDPADRYGSAGQFFQAIADALKGKRSGDISREEFEARKKLLAEAPNDDELALAVEQAGTQGIPWSEVVDALRTIADATGDTAAQKALRFRAARVLEAEVKDLAAARDLYTSLAEGDQGDDIAKARAQELRRALATPEERAEILLEDIDAAESAAERARLYVALARVYERDLKDDENALLAYTQALVEAPTDDDVASEVERLAGDEAKRWGETLSQISEATRGRDPAEAVPLLLRAGRWYQEKTLRPEFALACFNQAIVLAPGNDAALEGAATIYRKGQQWPELAGTLLKRADALAGTPRGRDVRAEAAELFEQRLNDATRARELAERVLAEDPTHTKANELVERLCIRGEDWKGLVELLERKAEALTGARRADALCELAEVYEDRLSDTDKAATYYERAHETDPSNLTALKGLERLHARSGNHERLLKVLQAQLPLAPTARQKVELGNRIGALLEEEFVDHTRAAEAYEEVVRIDAANDTALRGLGRTLRVLGRWDDLATLLERHASLVDDAPRKLDLLVSAGRVLLDPIGALDRAQKCFERAIEVEKNHTPALEALARIAALKGDVRAAVEAYDQLAQAAKTNAEKVEVLLKLGKVLEEKGDRDGAIERYKQALDVDPDATQATSRLRELYAARGDAQGAIELLQREIEAADGSNQRAALWAQVARIYRERLKDTDKAREAAEKARLLDATNDDAAAILGDIAFDEGRWNDAARLLAPRAARARELPRAEGLHLALRHGQALAKSGEGDRALAAFRMAREIAPEDRTALLLVAHAAYEAGAWKEAQDVYADALRRHGHELDLGARVEALCEYADAARKAGSTADALRAAMEAHELDGHNLRAIELAAELYAGDGRWDEVVKLKRRRAELVTGDQARFEAHLELGELLATKLGEKGKAARAYAAALEIKPDDRKLLTRLVQLYSDEKDWARLVEVVLRLADLVDDKALLGRYYLTAAQLCDVHLGRVDEAIDYYELALEHDPGNTKALDGLATLRASKNDWTGLEKSYRKVLAKMPESAPKTARAHLHALLAGLYEDKRKLNQPAEAVAEYEKAMEIAPGEGGYAERLAELYLSDCKRYFDRIVTTHRALLAKNPSRVESLHALRRAFTEARKPDEAWCMCQALVALKAAEPDEENFYKKFKTDRPAEAQEKLNEERWTRDLIHPTQDPLLTALFAAITPAVLRARAQKASDYGLSEANRIDPATHESAMARTVHYAAGVLALKPPPVHVLADHDSGLNFAVTDPPALFLGRSALAGGPAKALAFLAGLRLSYFRPGHQVRQIVPTGTALRAWFLAAIRAVQPYFPVSDELSATVAEHVGTIKQTLTGPALDVLTSVVSKVVQSEASLDLKRWMTGVDLTADRAGFILANDLPMALAVIRATPEDQSPVAPADRIRELRLYAISEEYLRLRQRMGIAMVVAQKPT